MLAEKNRALTIVVTVLIVAAFAAVDYLAPFVLVYVDRAGYRWLGTVPMGGLIGQVTLIATWTVLTPRNIIARVPWSLFFGLMMWYLLLFGLRNNASGPKPSPAGELVLGIVLLAGVFVLQIPLWVAKWMFRCRLLRPDEDPKPVAQERFQFELRDMLVGTLVFALALSPIRYILHKEAVGNLMLDPWLFLLAVAAVIANLLVTVPSLWGAFVSGPVWRLLLIWAIYSLVISWIEVYFVSSIGRPVNGMLEVCYTVNMSQAAVVFAVMRIYYALGYRLRRVPRFAATVPEAPA